MFRQRPSGRFCSWLVAILVLPGAAAAASEDSLQSKYDCRRSGNVPGRHVQTPLGLIGAVPLADAVFTAPVVAGDRVYVVDGSGTAWCIDAETMEVQWKFAGRGGPANCNNVSSPALADHYLHFGTMAGSYYVLDAASGAVVRKIACGDPIFSAPVLGDNRVYFATLGSRVYALEPNGTVCWMWDFVHQRLEFTADRWNGEDWARVRGRAGWREQFCCTRNIALAGKTLVVPAGGTIVWLDDVGDHAETQEALKLAQQRFGGLHGVFHLAGVLDDGLIELKSRDSIEGVLRPKVEGTRSLLAR